jgi:mono/diheme cytochrome c family protein
MHWFYPLVILLLCNCGGPPQASLSLDDTHHLGDAWYSHRAATLDLDLKKARERDAEFPGAEGPPPSSRLDHITAREAAALWKAICSGCHGPKGRPSETAAVRPRSWGGFGPRMGFFFGGNRMRSGLYRKISEGVPPAMPAWGSQLSREQIWALVKHIEGF